MVNLKKHNSLIHGQAVLCPRSFLRRINSAKFFLYIPLKLSRIIFCFFILFYFFLAICGNAMSKIWRSITKKKKKETRTHHRLKVYIIWLSASHYSHKEEYWDFIKTAQKNNVWNFKITLDHSFSAITILLSLVFYLTLKFNPSLMNSRAHVVDPSYIYEYQCRILK